MAVIATAQAISTPDGSPVYPQSYHFNEDPNSVPNPLSGKKYMTSTLAKFAKEGQFQEAREPKDFFPAYNPAATEPQYNQERIDRAGWARPSSSVGYNPVSYLNWKVEADLGELDNTVLDREADGASVTFHPKKYKSGWSNPLADTDSGHDDDLILFQLKADGSFKKHTFKGMNM